MTDRVGGGVSIFMVLFIVFLVLKLTHLIAWSWWWVTAPLWAPIALVLVIILFMFLIAVVAHKKFTMRRRH